MTSVASSCNKPDVDMEVKASEEESCNKDVSSSSSSKSSCEIAKLIKPDSELLEKSSELKAMMIEEKHQAMTVDSLNSNIPVHSTTVKKIPILDSSMFSSKPANVPVPKKLNFIIPRESFQLNRRPIVLSTHLVPSIPINLFENLASMIEDATNVPVVILHESRADRDVAQDIVDIAILPSSKEWTNGTLLPVSFVFEHRFNVKKTPGVWADIIIAQDVAQNIEEIRDLRGYKLAVADRNCAGLLFDLLRLKGENPSFFGNTLDSETQMATLQMVAGKQAEVGILEASVINCHKHSLPGINSIIIFDSLGPLPPYQFMVNNKLSTKHRDEIKNYLLKVHLNEDWMKILKPYGILGFKEYSMDFYNIENIKSVKTKVPYY